MPIVVSPFVPLTDGSLYPNYTEAEVIRSGVPEIDGCSLWTTLNAFIVSQGVTGVLEYVFRDRTGRPINVREAVGLTPTFGDSASDSDSEVDAATNIVVRIKEVIARGNDSSINPIWELTGTLVDAENGVARVRLSEAIVEFAGIYTAQWAIKLASGRVIIVGDSLLMVEKSLFPSNIQQVMDSLGPPCISDIRQCLLERGAADNDWLQRFEFSEEQILYAITTPIQYFNEANPPLGYSFTTRDFPWTNVWIEATLGTLFSMAANNHRRNYLPSSAGGVQIQDKAKEREYTEAAQRSWQTFKDWTLQKKVQLNAEQVSGSVRSLYGGW